MRSPGKTGPGQDRTDGEMLPATQVDEGDMVGCALQSYCKDSNAFNHPIIYKNHRVPTRLSIPLSFINNILLSQLTTNPKKAGLSHLLQKIIHSLIIFFARYNLH